MSPGRHADVDELIAVGREFHSRGWVLGTSGNFSAVRGRSPLRLLITVSGADKGALSADSFLEVDGDGTARAGAPGRPSDEHKLHLEVVERRAAGAVLHTHSVWSTLLSQQHAEAGGIAIEGYEMLKGLAGVRTHQHREWLPILDNDQDLAALAGRVRDVLQKCPHAHGFLLRRHGLYTWGATVREAKRHVEVLEFLLEVQGRSEWQSCASPNGDKR